MVACEIATELPRDTGGRTRLGSQGHSPALLQHLTWAGLDFSFGHRHQTSCFTGVHSFRFFTTCEALDAECWRLRVWSKSSVVKSHWQQWVLIWLKPLQHCARIHSTEHEAFGNWLKKPEQWKSCLYPSPAIIPKSYFQSACCLFSAIPPSVQFIWLGSCSVCSTFQEGRGQKPRHVSKKTDKLLWCHWCRKWVSHTLKDWYSWLVFLVQSNTWLCYPTNWSIIQWVCPESRTMT